MPVAEDALDLAAADAIAARFAARGGQPGLAYGIVAGGALVHSGGFGERWSGGPVPDADAVFRIASMTKSFTASLILLLRDRGSLRLDDVAQNYVPELSGVELPAPDCPPITLRHLLTMTAGFSTDDPWGDRQQGLDPADFARLLAAGGVRVAWAPGTTFEYSNLGYAILGRVIEAVTGDDYAAAVRAHLLEPLGMTQSGYEASEFDPSVLTRGYRRDSGTWLEVEHDPYGAFAPMGGVYSSVRDLSRWVAGFADAFPARGSSAGDRAHPLTRSARREMQLAQVAITQGGHGIAFDLAGPLSLSYGFGLFEEDDAAFGSIVQHSGGYPGYGSQMRWHPATGLGTVVLANGTYAAAGALASELLAALLGDVARHAGAYDGYRLHGPVPAPGQPWAETLAARASVDALLQQWDDGAASLLFSPNVEQDRPLAQRQADVGRLRERIGSFRPDAGRQPEFDSPAHCRWWLTGELGTVAVQIKLAPLQQPLVQQLIVPLPPAAGADLAEVLDQLIATLNDGARDWPDALTTAEGLSTGEVLRRLRIAAAWCGPCQVDSYLAGNGATAATVWLTGPDGRAELAAEIAGSGRVLTRLTVSLAQ
jgi:CubicO group peptidase (beta-lactamase class C family)